MDENPVNNGKLNMKPFNNLKVDVGENNMFSQKIDTNLWENAAKEVKARKPKGDSVQSQIFKFGEETQKYRDLLSEPFGNKIDYNC